jgi:hypothetical protein
VFLTLFCLIGCSHREQCKEGLTNQHCDPNPEFSAPAGLFVNALPSVNSMSVYADGASVTSGILFGEISPLVSLLPGIQDRYKEKIDITIKDDSTQLADFSAKFSNLDVYLFVMCSSSNGKVNPIILNTADQDIGDFKVRFVNATTTESDIDVYLLGSGDTLTDTKPILKNVGICESTDFTAVPYGTYHLLITAAGTKNVLGDFGEKELSLANSNTIVTYIVTDPKSGDGAENLVETNN